MKRLFVLLTAAVMLLCCACGKGSAPAKSLSEVYADILPQVTSQPIAELSDIRLMERYYGITSEMAEEFAGCYNPNGVDQEEIVLVKAANDDAAEEIESRLETRYQTKLNQNKDYNPEQAAMISACSVDRDGLYVSMIISQNAERMRQIYRDDLGLK